MLRRMFIPLMALSACAGEAEVRRDATAELFPEYISSSAEILDGDLVRVLLEMKEARGPDDLAAYGRCAVAQFALDQGYAFARHLRTNVEIEGGVWLGDAVYTISAEMPRGLMTIDAEVTVSDCARNGIPTV